MVCLSAANLFLQRLGSRIVARVVQQGLGSSGSSNGGADAPLGGPAPVSAYGTWSGGLSGVESDLMRQMRDFAAAGPGRQRSDAEQLADRLVAAAAFPAGVMSLLQGVLFPQAEAAATPPPPLAAPRRVRAPRP